MSGARFRALTAAAGLAVSANACGGAGGVGTGNGFKNVPPTIVASTIRIVGVGDSLTAGVQSGALFGLKGGTPNPFPAAYFPIIPKLVPFTTVPPTQGAGFWALMWSAANNGSDPYNPATSPLPLTNAPVGTMLVPSTITGPQGGAPTAFQPPCTGANALSYATPSFQQTRLSSVSPFDLGVPGQTLHEALYMVAPLTTCQATIDLTNINVGLAAIVNGESDAFYPVLGTFGNRSQVQDAVQLKPQIATVWLGSNDLLKPLFSNGAYPFTDPATFYADMVSVIQQLQGTGAKVAVANLLDVLHASYFTSSAELVAFMTQLAVPVAVQPYYLALVPPGGYLTLSGFLKIVQSIQKLGASGPPPVTLVAGDTVPASLATTTQTYNDAYNAQIAAAAKATGATLVDVHGAYAQIYAGGGYPVNPPACCSTIFGGGLTSLDGIHPSNTGYAIIANTFIQTLDQAFSLQIPPVSIGAIYATDPYAPH